MQTDPLKPDRPACYRPMVRSGSVTEASWENQRQAGHKSSRLPQQRAVGRHEKLCPSPSRGESKQRARESLLVWPGGDPDFRPVRPGAGGPLSGVGFSWSTRGPRLTAGSGAVRTHLSLLFERLDGEAVCSDVHDGSQLEPVRRVGRPHRLPILHLATPRALENMTQRFEQRRLQHPHKQNVSLSTQTTNNKLHRTWRDDIMTIRAESSVNKGTEREASLLS